MLVLKAGQYIKILVYLISSIICCLLDTMYWSSKRIWGCFLPDFLIIWFDSYFEHCSYSFECKADFFVSLVFTKC